MSLTLQKLSQIRKKIEEKEKSLQSGNYYDPEDAETSPLHSGLRHFWNEHLWITKLGGCASHVQVETTKYTEILSQLGRKDRPQNTVTV